MNVIAGDVAIKLYDANGTQLDVWYGSAGPATLDLTKLDVAVAKVAIMATSADVTVSVEPESVVFKAE